MAQLQNANLAGVKLTPQQRNNIIARFGAKYARRPDGSIDTEEALRKYGQRLYRIQNNLVGRQNATKARNAGALGASNTDYSGNALAPGQRPRVTQQSTTFGAVPPMTPTVPVKGGVAGGRPLVPPGDKQTSKRRQRIIDVIKANR